jgi:hypothetical protein
MQLGLQNNGVCEGMLVSFTLYLAQLAFKWRLITRRFKYDGRLPLIWFAVAKSYVSV